MRGMTETLTVWHKTRDDATKKDVWTRTVVLGCTWDSDIVRTVSGNTASLASVYVCLLPSDIPGKVSAGDLVAKGAQTAEITGVAPYRVSDVQAALAPDIFMVKTVTHCTAAYKRAPHIEIQGV